MALTRLQPAALQPSSFSGLNITDGTLYPVDLSTGAPQWNSGGSLTLGNATASTWDSNAKTVEFPQGALMGYGTTSMNLFQNAYLNASTINTYKQTGIASGSYAIASGNHTWRYAASGTAGNPITWNVGMTLLNTGKVGIGEPSPTQAALEVAPTIMGAAGISVKCFAGDTNGLKLSMDAAGVGYINAGYNVSSLVLQTGGNARLTIDQNGMISVGSGGLITSNWNSSMYGGGGQTASAVNSANIYYLWAAASARGSWFLSGNNPSYSAYSNAYNNDYLVWNLLCHEASSLAVNIWYHNHADSINRTAVVDYSLNGGSTWTNLNTITFGSSGGSNVNGTIDLTGGSAAGRNVRIRTYFSSGASNSSLVGIGRVYFTLRGGSMQYIASLG